MTEAVSTLPGILAFFHDIAPDKEAEFEEWFQREHLPERIAIPGFLAGRRYEAISARPRYFHFYVTQSVEVFKSAIYLGRVNAPTLLTSTVMSEITKGVTRTVCRRTSRFGAMRGSCAVAVRLGQREAETELKATIELLMQDNAVACAEVWRATDPGESPLSEEERLRGGDRKIEACLVVETLRPADGEKIAETLGRRFQIAEIGVYRLLCDIAATTFA